MSNQEKLKILEKNQTAYDESFAKMITLAVGSSLRQEIQMLWAEREALKDRIKELEREIKELKEGKSK